MRILFVKLGAIGDVVQAAVAVSEYRRRYPHHKLDWVVGRSVSALVDAFGVSDELVVIDDLALLSSSYAQKGPALIKAMIRLWRLGKYDRVVTAYADRRYEILTCGVGARRRVRFSRALARPSPIQHRSRVHEYWCLLSGSDGEAIDIAAATKVLGRSVLNRVERSEFGSLPSQYLILAPGGAKNTLREDNLRRWPIDNYLGLAEKLLRAGRNVVLVGGLTDRWINSAFANMGVVNLIGETTLVNLLPVLDGADAIVGNDSGILHLAALTNAGIVALFGPTPANAFVPRGRDRTIVLEEGNRVSCSPCYDGKNYAPCSRNICLEAITVSRVFEAVESLCEP